MEVDEVVVDLSISSNRGGTLSPAAAPNHIQAYLPIQGGAAPRRVLRPRTEPRSYVESPDVLINGTLDPRPRLNGNVAADYSSDSSDGGEPVPLMPIKELTPSELKQRERGLKRLREELRNEEMKLVLLKKLKQSQQLKENVAVLPPSIPASAIPPSGLPSGLSITPTTVKVPPAKSQPQHSPVTGGHSRHSVGMHGKPLQANMPITMRGPPPPRSSIHVPQSGGVSVNNRGANLSVPQPPQRSSVQSRPSSGYPPGLKDLSPSVTITPAPPPIHKDRSQQREDNQTPAQRQAAAKLALRKQLEKTLLQIPPPKPPPPEMHFIPNPSNTEFIYLVGLEHVVDFLTKESRIPAPPNPFSCSQCSSDFTPVWKWETKGKTRVTKVICEQCVTNNVKKALKAEHTNRLKTAFVKALQQEQEIEQRLAQNGGSFTSSSPAASPAASSDVPSKSATPTPVQRHAATPPAPPPQQPPQVPPPAPPSARGSSHQSQQAPPQDKYSQQSVANAAAMQALHQQLMRTLTSGGPPAHMLQFSHLFYPYQLAMAQAAAAGKGATPPNMAEMHRAAEMQRQYLLDMIPQTGTSQRHWKT